MDTLLFILKILGSLGVFLYGMKVMSEGIQRSAGDRMRRIMATMTHNRFTAVLTGLLITSLVQSSSASTVMVVSFVNAGLLTLVESIGIIMGANLGTTLTAWIIATVGKFSLSEIAIPIIGVGLPLFFIGKNRWKNFGEILIGFGLLFYGLHLLKETVPDVKGMLTSTDAAIQEQAREIQAFVANFSGKGYLSVLVFLFLGIVLTLIVQSSSAAMAITVTLAIQGWIGFEESAAIVLGENIGTTVTAWLASIGTTVNARRAARAHLLFNVIGVVWMLVIFYPFTELAVWLGSHLPDSWRGKDHSADIGFHLAIFHSLFNFANILLLVAFVPQIARIVTKLVKETPSTGNKTHRLRFISGGMVDLGELNLPEAENSTRELAGITRDMFIGYLDVFKNPAADLSSEVKRLKALEDEADVLTHDITEYLVRTSAAEISQENARSVTRMLRIVSELEEISDAIYRLIQITQRKYEKGRAFGDEATDNVLIFATKIVELIDLYSEVLLTGASETKLHQAQEIEKATDKLRKQYNKQAMKRMTETANSVKTEMLTIDMNNQFELIANYGLNVVQSAYYLLKHDEIPD
ncbi:MAG: Na/Pi cotransporter family protein [Verrucomicrobiales bacterium]|jgi:phosphate:Na+ symporter|nr:Na/Pi cotransporter family protein [Verrucomicrobiales bacterium]MDP4792570.1 Na/Pi cotransporter family protein [Verrucomicrobiales bacterium]MDP4940112.1 Na/Pi cotransporter family protein [Verrucomicrobiales bacterium]MDP5007010.1 Na/Pi cotransporter family protein [Verrucomicrobiales bacterium]